MSSDLHARLVADEALRREGVGIVVDALLARRVADLVDVPAMTDLMVSVLARHNVERALFEHFEPGYVRVREAVRASGQTVGDFVPAKSREGLVEMVARMQLPSFAWGKGAIDPALLKDLFAPALRAWLLMFVKKMPLGGGLAGALGKIGGGKGKKLVGAMDERMQGAAESFSRGASEELREAIAQRVASEEGQRIIKEIRKQIVAHLMTVNVAEIFDDLEALPRRELLGLLPAIVEANAARDFGKALIKRELEAMLEVEGKRTLREVADEAGILPELRAYLRVQAETLLEALLETANFQTWLGTLSTSQPER